MPYPTILGRRRILLVVVSSALASAAAIVVPPSRSPTRTHVQPASRPDHSHVLPPSSATPTRALDTFPRSARRVAARSAPRSRSHVLPRARRSCAFSANAENAPKAVRDAAARSSRARLLAAPLHAPAVGLRTLGECRAHELTRRMTLPPTSTC
ncbi:hypothetical protein K523DRAFT_358579 [Schizophyllum commune Tattone D]|nr:hypothetical protein K523DRAFT_358579 [Schizophyllum commune Tattone D]